MNHQLAVAHVCVFGLGRKEMRIENIFVQPHE